MIAEFKIGTPKRKLAKRYGIGVGSIKNLLREEGVWQRLRYDMQP